MRSGRSANYTRTAVCGTLHCTRRARGCADHPRSNTRRIYFCNFTFRTACQSRGACTCRPGRHQHMNRHSFYARACTYACVCTSGTCILRARLCSITHAPPHTWRACTRICTRALARVRPCARTRAFKTQNGGVFRQDDGAKMTQSAIGLGIFLGGPSRIPGGGSWRVLGAVLGGS